ncbi:MAG: hypothetical protein NC079_01145 [Clostridium sp.]|nr:hypothetical protein [Acetatifactor muris]MCM1526046.1 hypothetical protein [Bacteroides sp.]MCM1562194.1 hypothetical protein [Clostridium sp.]
MEVDILIDGLTDCLVERKTGEQVETEYRLRLTPIKPKDYAGWKFDWSRTEKNGYDIYELFLADDDAVQGRISLRTDGGVADVDIVETAPHNYGHTGQYQGVGGHLFAIACQVSIESGCDGYVAFTAKSNLITYYQKVLNARVASGQRMYIDEPAADILIKKYIRK